MDEWLGRWREEVTVTGDIDIEDQDLDPGAGHHVELPVPWSAQRLTRRPPPPRSGRP